MARRTARRAAEVAGRLEELRRRRLDLAGGPPRDPGSGAALLAAERAAEARLRAVQAHEDSIRAHLSAAAAHERVAGLFEYLAASGLGDAEYCRRHAERHREGARADHEQAERAREGHRT
ncbi:hypothetical protein [Actinomadura sp. 9N407]|uniref:hypothetical protein n=1 Tax=Actinomadura sp. 9N407 TaxID=3375154 RepID=UPI0037B4D490